MEKYTKEELEHIHEIGKEALDDFSKICEKYNLKYWLLAGAALGAVRHQGPIPWDDDIDLGMLREDYDMFLKVCQNELGNKYRFTNYMTQPDYPLLVTNMARNGTKFVRKNFAKLHCTVGIGIDIFPFDNVPSDSLKRKKQVRKAWFWNKLYIIRNMWAPQVPGKGLVKKLILAVCGVTHAVMALLHVPRKFIISRYFKAAKQYEGENTGLVASFCETYPERTKLYLDDLFPLKSVPYMDIQVYLPNNYDKMLTDSYGDYMTIPPIEKRKSNRPYILQFDESNE